MGPQPSAGGISEVRVGEERALRASSCTVFHQLPPTLEWPRAFGRPGSGFASFCFHFLVCEMDTIRPAS